MSNNWNVRNSIFFFQTGLDQSKVDYCCLSLTSYCCDQKQVFIALFLVFIDLKSKCLVHIVTFTPILIVFYSFSSQGYPEKRNDFYEALVISKCCLKVQGENPKDWKAYYVTGIPLSIKEAPITCLLHDNHGVRYHEKHTIFFKNANQINSFSWLIPLSHLSLTWEEYN